MSVSKCRGINHFEMPVKFTTNNPRFPPFLSKTVCIMKEKKDRGGRICFPTEGFYPINSSSHLC